MSSLKNLEEIENLFLNNNYPDAEKELHQYIHHNDKNALAYRILGNIYINTGRDIKAQKVLKKSIALDNTDSKTSNLLGISYENLYDFKKARDFYEQAVNLKPDFASAQSNYIGILEKLNLVKEARLALEHAKDQCKDHSLFIIREATILKREHHYEQAIEILKKGGYPEDPKSILLAKNQLAQLYDKNKNYDKATEEYVEFNNLATEIYNITPADKSIYLNKITAYKKYFTEDLIVHWPKLSDRQVNDEKQKVFLTGFARSGTTLLQHILTSHPKIHSTEEIPAIPRIVEMLEQQMGDYPSCLQNLDKPNINVLQNFYMDVHRQDHDWEEKDILIDKYPFGTINIGISHLLFPKAKFIFAARHPCDCILSSYFQFLHPNEGMIHTYKVEDTVNLYCELMDIWQLHENLLPLDVLSIKYEDVVDDMPAQVQRILDFLEIEWDDNVLSYTDNVVKRGNIRTPSYSQVSNKIYKESQYRWKNYEDLMKPHLNKLEPYIKWLGY